MAEIRPSYSILLLIDNTYSMDKTTIESFPYISFAKSVVKLIIERSRMCKMRLIIVYSDPFGKPKTIIPNLAQPPFQVPMEISHLEVSPSGFFDETIQEGFIQLNKTRYQKDPAEPYFVQKKNEFYSILLFTDGWGLSSDFYKFKAANEWLIRPDESIFFCNICHSDPALEKTPTYAATKFNTAYEQIDFEFLPFFTPYSGTGKLFSYIFSNAYYFHFSLIFGSKVVKAKVQLTNFIWPFPYDPTANEKENILPQYTCIYLERTANVKRIKHANYEVIGKFDSVDYGNYIVYDDADGGVAFGILEIIDKDRIFFKLLPYNFLFLLQNMNPLPSKSICDEYLNNLPQPYYDGIISFFRESRYEYSDIAPKPKREFQARLRNREDFYKNQDNINNNAIITKISLDPSRFSENSLRTLLNMMPKTRKDYLVKKTPCKIAISNDTIDDEKTFQSLEIVRPKYHSGIIYQRTQSQLRDNFIKSIMPKSAEAAPEEKAMEIVAVNQIYESMFDDDTEADDITLLEDLLILLRDRETTELERRLNKMKDNAEFFSFVKAFILNSIQRFNIEKLPPSLISLLNSSDTNN